MQDGRRCGQWRSFHRPVSQCSSQPRCTDRQTDRQTQATTILRPSLGLIHIDTSTSLSTGLSARVSKVCTILNSVKLHERYIVCAIEMMRNYWHGTYTKTARISRQLLLVQNLYYCERLLLEYMQTRVYYYPYTGTLTQCERGLSVNYNTSATDSSAIAIWNISFFWYQQKFSCFSFVFT